MALASYSISTPWLQIWHERMGHLGEQVLGRMKEGPHKVPFKPGTYPLEFIHTDIAGPFPVPGNKGDRYWVTFLDDKTKMAEAYPISKRSEFFQCFRHFLEKHEWLEQQCHCLRL